MTRKTVKLSFLAKVLGVGLAIAILGTLIACQNPVSPPVPTYTITYSGNGNNSGNPPSDVKQYTSGTTAYVLDNTGGMVKTGYPFNGWNTQADGTGIGFGAGDPIIIGSGNMTLYAVWDQVAYEGNGATGGSVPTDHATYPNGSTVTTSSNSGGLVKTGCTLAGWTTSISEAGSSYAIGATFTISASPVKLYAIWVPDNLTFVSSGTSITITGSAARLVGSLDIPKGVTKIGVEAFWNSGLVSVTIPPSAIDLDNECFCASDNLTSIVVDPANPYYCSIDGILFNKDATIIVQVPGGITGTYTIPPSVIGFSPNRAFGWCSKLSRVIIPSNVKSINSNTFFCCDNLTFTVAPANPNYCSIDDALLSKDAKILIRAPGRTADGSYTVPSSVTSLYDYSLDSTNLTSITIPQNITDMTNVNFVYSFYLIRITLLPRIPPSLGSDAFLGCWSDFLIHVPSGTLADYQSASGWSEYADKIVEDPL